MHTRRATTPIPFLVLAALLAVPASDAVAQDGPKVDAPALAFQLVDTYGETHSLEKHRGSWVVLEWLNYGCPYVQKHYRTGNIPSQQERWREEGVVWLAIVTSPPGAQGYYEPDAMNAKSEEMGSNATAVLYDSDGTVGRAYGARTTPQMFVIDPEGTLVYMGGIDDVPTARDQDLERATQLADQALREATAGQPVTTPVSQPYGCNVKYR